MFIKLQKKFLIKRIAKTIIFFLFLLPFFFGHLAINNKDTIITFAHVWIMYYLIKYTVKNFNLKNKFLIVLFKISILSALRNRYSAFIFRLFNSNANYFFILFIFFKKKKKLAKLLLDLGIYFIFFYLILVLFWVDTHSNIFHIAF